jgi:hypothetical protein
VVIDADEPPAAIAAVLDGGIAADLAEPGDAHRWGFRPKRPKSTPVSRASGARVTGT